jgi:hypothetical protein
VQDGNNGEWPGKLGIVDDEIALGQGYRDFLSYFGIPVRVDKPT